MKRFLALLAPALLIQACSLFNTDTYVEPHWYEDSSSHDMIVLGEQLEDPYSVENITKAIESLYPTKAGRVNLDPTDMYVRFLPTSDEDCEMLEDMGVLMIDHPLDYSIVRDGDYYHDPTVPDDDITWQYAVVDIGFRMPEGIKYEVLDKCYIADNDYSTKAGDIEWLEVEREAYRLTGNGAMLTPESKSGEAESCQPSGRITIVDDALGSEPIGVKGVLVTCNTFVKIGKAYTDENGNYTMKRSYSSDIRYSLRFKNKKGFAIGMNLLLVNASSSSLGRNSPKGVSVEITKDSDRKLFTRSVVNNAGYDYFESCSADGEEITAPPSNLRIWLFQRLSSSSAVMLQQGAVIDDSVISEFLDEYTPLLKMFLPDITLGLKGRQDYASIYREAIHEMAHASHFMQAGKPWWNKFIKYILKTFVTSGGTTYGSGTETDYGYCEVGEMWAYYVETKLYRERYKDTDAAFGTSFWFNPQIFMFLDDRGLDRFKIFQALTSDITEKNTLQDKLLSLYPESKSIINQAFNRYK